MAESPALGSERPRLESLLCHEPLGAQGGGGLSQPSPIFSATSEAATWISGAHSCAAPGVAVTALMAVLSPPPSLPGLSSPHLSPSLFPPPHSPTPQKKEAGMRKGLQDGQDRRKAGTRGHPRAREGGWPPLCDRLVHASSSCPRPG